MIRLSDNARGALLMSLAMAGYTFNDACIKLLSQGLPWFQAVFLRGILVLPVLIVFGRMFGGISLRFSRADWGRVLLRAGCEIAATYFFLTALFHMPLGNVTAILQVSPLTITLAGALFLSEPVGRRRMLAIAVGFLGVMLIIRPGTDAFDVYSLYALAAVVAITLRDLVVRRMSPDVSSMGVALVTALSVTLVAGVGSLSESWIMPDAWQILTLLGAAVFIGCGYAFSVMTMRVGDMATVTPFRYSALLWALVLGVVLFGDWPDFWEVLGAVIVVASGTYALLRERLRTRRRVSVAGE